MEGYKVNRPVSAMRSVTHPGGRMEAGWRQDGGRMEALAAGREGRFPLLSEGWSFASAQAPLQSQHTRA